MWGFLPALITVVVGLCFYVPSSILWLHNPEKNEMGPTLLPPLFCKPLRAKMRYYRGRKLNWLIVYMNLILPAVALLRINAIVQAFATTSNINAWLIIDIVVTLICILNMVAFRGVDDIAYWVNLISQIVIALYIFLPAINNPLAVFFIVGASIVNIALLLPNFIYFHRRRELLMKSDKQLQREYGMIEDDVGAD